MHGGGASVSRNAQDARQLVPVRFVSQTTFDQNGTWSVQSHTNEPRWDGGCALGDDRRGGGGVIKGGRLPLAEVGGGLRQQAVQCVQPLAPTQSPSHITPSAPAPAAGTACDNCFPASHWRARAEGGGCSVHAVHSDCNYETTTCLGACAASTRHGTRNGLHNTRLQT